MNVFDHSAELTIFLLILAVVNIFSICLNIFLSALSFYCLKDLFMKVPTLSRTLLVLAVVRMLLGKSDYKDDRFTLVEDVSSFLLAKENAGGYVGICDETSFPEKK